MKKHSPSTPKLKAAWTWIPIKPSAPLPQQHVPSHNQPQTLFALQISPKLPPPRTRVKVLGLTSSVKRVAHMVFKRDHSTVAANGDSPNLLSEDSDPKKLRASSPPIVQIPGSPAGSSPPASNEDGGGSPSGAAATAASELPDFLLQDPTSLTQKFKALDVRQRERFGDSQNEDSDFYISEDAQVVSRNRYANIHVWSSTRVKLGIDAADNDYINASYIAVESEHTGPKQYIATQGPKQDQARHLWLMALEQTAGPGVIVMLTKTFEMGREKCYSYFPQDMQDNWRSFDRPEPGTVDPFNFELNLLDYKYDEEARTEIRKIEIKVLQGTHTAAPDASGYAKELGPGDTKIVWHLLFKGWPDWNVPEGDDSDALLKLIELANEKNEVPESPLIVHCSAGVGRSGTFIALDHMLPEINHGTYDSVEGETDPIFDLVDKLRVQRMYMVQSESQFEYLYRIVREKMEERHGIPPENRFLCLPTAPSSSNRSIAQRRASKAYKKVTDMELAMIQESSTENEAMGSGKSLRRNRDKDASHKENEDKTNKRRKNEENRTLFASRSPGRHLTGMGVQPSPKRKTDLTAREEDELAMRMWIMDLRKNNSRASNNIGN
ncbi:hypothetical protein TWF788_003297 [Orbilia oligospora]|uniref:Uncharacterized protein n=1 Tax=Orbilia oligospora TaxID=2813651 RepID=A0A7C8U7P6_ORBOL|nr:hypothetical protein TWF788_003297 [Orbilia oligospora]